MQYAHAGAVFEKFMRATQARLDLATGHQTYQAVHGVLIVFRRRLTVEQGLRFADVLPAVLRAMFVAEWDIAAPVLAFDTRAAMTREVQQVRVNHNLSPDHAIAAVAASLWEVVDPVAFARCLDQLGPEVQAFWEPDRS